MKSGIGTEANPCTATNSTTEQRKRKFCLCTSCGRIARCTPDFDFYTRPRIPSSLICTYCYQRGALF